MTAQPSSKDSNDFFSNVAFGVLAYVRADGTPIQRRFGSFAKKGQTIFFSTRADAAKVKEIEARPRVSFLLEPDGQKLAEWKSELYLGRASALQPGEELSLAVELLSARNPRFRDRIAKEGLGNTRIFALRFDEVDSLDYGKGFGHSEKILVSKDEVV